MRAWGCLWAGGEVGTVLEFSPEKDMEMRGDLSPGWKLISQSTKQTFPGDDAGPCTFHGDAHAGQVRGRLSKLIPERPASGFEMGVLMGQVTTTGIPKKPGGAAGQPAILPSAASSTHDKQVIEGCLEDVSLVGLEQAHCWCIGCNGHISAEMVVLKMGK